MKLGANADRTYAPDFPLAGAAFAPLRSGSEPSGCNDFTPLWSGQAARLGREPPAGELTVRLAKRVRPYRGRSRSGCAVCARHHAEEREESDERTEPRAAVGRREDRQSAIHRQRDLRLGIARPDFIAPFGSPAVSSLPTRLSECATSDVLDRYQNARASRAKHRTEAFRAKGRARPATGNAHPA